MIANPHRATTNKRLLIALDLDGTTCGHRDSTDELSHYLRTMRDDIALVYATGRNPDSARDLIEAERIPRPDALVAGVGTHVSWRWRERDDEWHRAIASDFERAALINTLADATGLTMQVESEQSPVKLSYMTSPQFEGIASLRARIQRAKLQARAVHSSGRHLDIIPARAGKARAIAHIMQRLGMSDALSIAAGDSGNDRAMIVHCDRGVVVANHQPELATLRGRTTIYFAQESFGRGVLEGLQHWFARSGF